MSPNDWAASSANDGMDLSFRAFEEPDAAVFGFKNCESVAGVDRLDTFARLYALWREVFPWCPLSWFEVSDT
jgi:hypothetical protein